MGVPAGNMVSDNRFDHLAFSSSIVCREASGFPKQHKIDVWFFLYLSCLNSCRADRRFTGF